MAEVSADDISLINSNTGPYITLGARTILDAPPGGNGNGRLDPGESGGLLIALRNIGVQGLNDVQARLRSLDSRLLITDSTVTYGTIPACSTRVNTDHPFGVRVDPAIPVETPVRFELFISGSDYCDTLHFTIVVGEFRPDDPIPDNAQPPIYWAYDDIDTVYPQHPEFFWIEINNRGTRLTLNDDQTIVVDLPFIWRFYGQTFNQISICSNGWVAPGYTTTAPYNNTRLPTPSIPGAVCLNWDDLYPPYGNGVWYYHDAENHRFIVEWDSVYYFGATQWERFQMVLYDTTVPSPTGDNIIIVQYLTAHNYTSSTVGIQDPTLTFAIQCLFNGTYHRGSAPIAPGRAIKYTTATPTALAQPPDFGPRKPLISIHPNPSRGTLQLSINIPAQAVVTIYDQTGRRVRTLSGNGPWIWDGRDESGNRVGPGVYFCRISNPELQTEGKLVIAR